MINISNDIVNIFLHLCRMFDGILSDVIGRDGHVSEAGNGNKNNNSNGGGGDDHLTTPDVATMVGVFERHVTRYNNHLLRVRDPAAVSLRQCDQEVEIPTDVNAPTSVSYCFIGDELCSWSCFVRN